MSESADPFSDPSAVAAYAERTARLVPGLKDLHTMAALLLAERSPADARVLVLGAGGGLELKAFAEHQPGWTFDGVDPSPEMLLQARATVGDHAPRIAFHEGTIGVAPDGPYDAASCLLTLHFLPAADRFATLREVHRRLKPGAPFVTAHHSIPGDDVERTLWLTRYAAFSGTPAAQAESSIRTIREHLPILSPAEDAALIRDAGFRDVSLFYAAFTFKGWIAYRD